MAKMASMATCPDCGAVISDKQAELIKNQDPQNATYVCPNKR